MQQQSSSGDVYSGQQGAAANSGTTASLYNQPGELKDLPKYMTSCYPFVQGDPGYVILNIIILAAPYKRNICFIAF